MGRGVLFLLTGFLVIFGIIQNAVQNRQFELSKRAPAYYYAEESRNIATAMTEVALAKFNKNFYWTGPYTAQDFMGKGNVGKIRVDSTTNFGSRVYLTITGIAGTGDIRTKTTVKAVANRPAFSIYSYFTDIEPVIYFADNDVINGPVHTNGTFHIDGDPIFNGKVTSPNEPDEEWGSKPQYNKGRNFKADSIKLPKDLAQLSDEASSRGLQYDDDKIKVEFNEDGSADITKYTETGSYQGDCIAWNWWGNCKEYKTIYEYSEISTQNYSLAKSSDFNGVISSSGKVEVKGTLKGNITLHSKEDIEIIGDVVYKDFDPDNPDKKLNSGNLLGLVSEKNVIVDENAHKNSGDRNLNITASIMAMGESFEVEKYNIGNHRGKLRVLGGLIQKKRGAVGTSGGTGYDKYYSYDKRFSENSTPNFPKVKRFEIDSWKETTVKVLNNSE